MYGAVHKSLFNNKLVDITRPLYSETFLPSTSNSRTFDKKVSE